MTDIANKCFTWKSVTTVQDNLTDFYPQLNITVTDLNEYTQCGYSYEGSPGTQDNYFKAVFGSRPHPPKKEQCICGQPIKVQCYVWPKKDMRYENIIVVGNECIDKFGDGFVRGKRVRSVSLDTKIETLICAMDTYMQHIGLVDAFTLS